MKKILIGLLLTICSTVFSQKTVQNQRVWFSYLGQYKVSEKWGFQMEAQLRLDNQLQQNLQDALKLGAVYYLSSKENLVAGYALVNTLNSSLDKFFKENRFWEQYQVNKKWDNNKNTISHRFRLEQRWVEQLTASLNENNITNYQNRVRYLNRNLFHIANLKSNKDEFYAVVQDEIFLTLGNNEVNSKVVDQNRFLIGLGLNYNITLRFELGYMNQFVTSSYGNDVMNHAISVSLLQNLDLHK